MKTLLLSAALCCAGAFASAQDIYAGGAFDYANPHSGDASLGITVLGGMRFGAGAVTFGPEVDYSLTNDGDYGALRLRAMARHDTGVIALMGGLGYTNYDLDSGGSADGLNFGLGLDYEIGAKTDLRVEVIRDMMDSGQSDVTNIRIGTTYAF